MAKVQLFAKQQTTANYVQLDLISEEPIKLNLSVTDMEDPMVATSVFSRTFKVPHTSVNGPFFESVFNVNCEDFDITQKADAYLMDNGIQFSNGNLRLNSIYTNHSTGNVEYEVIFYGETSDLGSKIGAGFLNSITLVNDQGISYNHQPTYSNITNSWSNNLFNGDIVYGLIEWGYEYDADNKPVASQGTLSHNFSESFTTINSPLKLEQMKPQFRAKALFDCIMRDAGFTYDSTFLNSEFFKKMYIISENKASATFAPTNTSDAVGPTIVTTLDILNNPEGLSTYYPYPATTEIIDPGNNYEPSTSTYTTPATGLYTFHFTFIMRERPPKDGEIAHPLLCLIRIVDEAGVQYGSSGWTFHFDTDDGDPVDRVISVNIPTGKTVRAQYKITYSNQPNLTEIDVFWYQPHFTCSAAPNPIATSTILPSNIKKIDFMRSIINRFRLIFVPDKNRLNHFTITPWKDWIYGGTKRDWTNKLDQSKDIKITPLFLGQSRSATFKDQEDSDYMNDNYQKAKNLVYGQLDIDSQIEMITNTKVYQDQFAPTPISAIGYKSTDTISPKWLVPHMAKDSPGSSADNTGGIDVIGGKREPMQPKLRLVFYNGLHACPTTRAWYLYNGPNSTGTGIVQNTYPLMTPYENFPVTDGDLDLNWKNIEPLWDITDADLGTGFTSKTVFTEYWSKWYDIVYDPYARIVDATLVLDYSDLIDFNFNDYIFIKNAWYFVNSITDYVVGQRTACKVQLVKLGKSIDLQITGPSTLTEILLCLGRTACEAYCCSMGAAFPTTYWIDAPTLAEAHYIYLDPQGIDPAGSDFYSDQTDTVFVLEDGYISYPVPNIIMTNQTYNNQSTPPTQLVVGTVYTVVAGTIVILDDGSLAAIYNVGDTFNYATSTANLPDLFTITFNGEFSYEGSGSSLVDTSACSCGFAIYDFTTHYSTDLCLSCGLGAAVTVYGKNATFANCGQLWLDNALTIIAPEGYYREDGSTYSLRVDSLGFVIQIATCQFCPPVEYQPYTASLSTTACLAYCQYNPIPVWTNNADWNSSTEIYFDNSGTFPAELGYYAVGNEIAVVQTTAGVIDSWTTNAGCDPCAVGPIRVDLNLYQYVPGCNSSATLYTSLDDGFWNQIGSVSIDETQPLNTEIGASFLVDEFLYLKVVYGTNMIGGDLSMSYMDTNIPINASSGYSFKQEAPGYFTIFAGINPDANIPPNVTHTQTAGNHQYTFWGFVENGTAPSVITYYPVPLYYHLTSYCTAFCHLNMINTTYYGDNLTLGTCTHLYQDLLATTPCIPGYYSDGVVACEVGAAGLITRFLNTSLCSCGGISYEYVTVYDANSSCNACSSSTVETIYSGISSLDSSTVVYSDYNKTTYPTAGFYSYLGRVFEVGANGVILSKSKCLSQCIPDITSIFIIRNMTAYSVDYSYTDSSETLQTGTIPKGRYVYTTCCNGVIETTGYCTITEYLAC